MGSLVSGTNSDVDPITIEVLESEMNSITEEMALVIMRTARSPLLKAGDFATAVADRQGRVVGAMTTYAVWLYHLLLKAVLEKFDGTLAPGDVILSNDPWSATSHLPDVAAIAPVFNDGALAAFVCTYSHHSDIGGRFGGGVSSMPASIFEEGIRIPLVKARDAGALDEALLEVVLANVRNPEEWRADLQAKIAGCDAGARAIAEVVRRHGLATFDRSCDVLLDRGEGQVRDLFRTIPEGTYAESASLVDEALSVPAEVRLSMTVRDGHITVDFTGSSPQVPNALNAPVERMGAALSSIMRAAGWPSPTNLGCYRAVTVVAPPGSIVNPSFPAAVGARATTRHVVHTLIARAIAKAMIDRAEVPSSGNAVLQFAGGGATGTAFVVVDLMSSGSGARSDSDGVDGISDGFGSVVSAEILERQYPIVVEGFGFVPDTEGAGEYRGSVSVFRKWRFGANGSVILRRHEYRDSPGLDGGASGKAGKAVMNPGRPDEFLFPEASHVHAQVRSGDTIYLECTASGGYGNPYDRDPERVLQDIRDEKVTAAAAAVRYGVIVDERILRVDTDATHRRRADRNAAD
jgi:N-methylhydantoinase B